MTESNPNTMPDADDALLLLGAELERLWATERKIAQGSHKKRYNANAFKAARDKTASVVQEIAQLDAASLPGLSVQARALLWIDNDDYLPIVGRCEWGLRRKIIAGVVRLGKAAESGQSKSSKSAD